MVEWLIINNQNTPPEKEAFPKPEQRPDGSYIYERIPSVGGEAGGGGARHQMLYKKRAYEERPAQPGDTQQPVPSKVGKQQSRAYSVNQVTPKGARKWMMGIHGQYNWDNSSRKNCHDDSDGRGSENCHQLAGRTG